MYVRCWYHTLDCFEPWSETKAYQRSKNETRYPSRLRRVHGALQLRQHLQDPLDQARARRRPVQRVPPVLHGPAEVRRYRGRVQRFSNKFGSAADQLKERKAAEKAAKQAAAAEKAAKAAEERAAKQAAKEERAKKYAEKAAREAEKAEQEAAAAEDEAKEEEGVSEVAEAAAEAAEAEQATEEAAAEESAE